MKTHRRKYLFADRATAEDECARQARLNDHYRVALEATVNNEVEWIKGNHYDVGLAGKSRADGGLVLLVFHGRNLTQRPSTTVYMPDEIRDWRRILYSPCDEEQRELAELLDKAIALLTY